MDDLRVDILGELPSEVALDILELLDPEDLGRCLGVSKTWRSSANRDILWKRFCRYEDWVDDADGPEPPYDQLRGLSRLCFWATLYSRVRIRVRRNWRANRHKKYIVEPGGQRRDQDEDDNRRCARVLTCADHLLVIGVECPPGLDLYSVLCMPRHLANLPPPIGGYPVQAAAATPRFLVVLQRNLLFFFDRSDPYLQARYFIAADSESHRCTVYPMDPVYVEYALTNCSAVEYFTAIGDCVFVEIATSVFQVDCRHHRPMECCSVSFFAGRRLFKDPLRFYVLEEDLLTVLEGGGSCARHLQLEPPAHQNLAYRVFSNRNVLVVLCKSSPARQPHRTTSHVFVAYDIQTGIKISETPSWKPYGYALHPSRDVLVCSTKRCDSTDVLTCLDLKSSGQVLWDLPEPTDCPLAHQELEFLQDSLLLAMPRADWEIYTALKVIDALEGLVLYTLEIEATALLTVTDRLVAYLDPDDRVEILTFRL